MPLADTADAALRSAIDVISSDLAQPLGPNGVAFLRRLYAQGLQNYQRRLDAVGLASGERLLDAGSGFGQWCFAAAGGYDDVVGIDLSGSRVAACGRLAQLSGATNCHFEQGSLERLPFADGSFDASISYSALYFTDFVRTFGELARVLKPGGKLYFSTNDIGRFLMDIVESRNPAADFSPRVYGFATIGRTVLQRVTGRRWLDGATAMSKRGTVSALEKAGFKIVEIGPEGSLGRGDKPMQRGRYAGFTAVFDVLALRT